MKPLLADFAIFCSVVVFVIGCLFLVFTATLGLDLFDHGVGLSTLGMLSITIIVTRF